MQKFRKGFIAIEAVIIAAVCIMGGIAGTSAFLKNGQGAQKQSAEMINNTIEMIEEDFDFNTDSGELPDINEGSILNEYGFYDNRLYVAHIDYLDETVGLLMGEDNTLNLITLHAGAIPVEYLVSDGLLSINIPTVGGVTASISENGTEIYCHELAETFKLGDKNMVIDEDYVYVYEDDVYYGTEINGYIVSPINKSQATYTQIKKEIKGIPVQAIAHSAFADNDNLIIAPTIPDSILMLGEAVFSGCDNLESIVLPDSVTGIGSFCFEDCPSLVTVRMPKVLEGYSIGTNLFRNCYSLTSIVIPKNYGTIDNGAFENCSSLQDIHFNGTIEEWNDMYFAEDWNTNVPATEVKCSNGTVSL